MILSRLLPAILFMGQGVASRAQTQDAPPQLNPLALTAENLCLGIKNILATPGLQQDFSNEAKVFCSANLDVPTPELLRLIASPYQGVGLPTFEPVFDPYGVRAESGLIDLLVTYSMSVPRNPVAALLGEEKHIPVPYRPMATEELSVIPTIGPRVENRDDCDTAFSVIQRTRFRNNQVRFDDTSTHDLKLYRMHQNNFDFFAAARTLRSQTDIFRNAVVFRVIMRDPRDPNRSLSVTAQRFKMRDFGQEQQVVERYVNFLRTDMVGLYNEQSNPL